MPPRLNNFLKQRVILLIIDRLIVGILAAVIILLAQQCVQKKEDERQKRIAASTMESRFIINALNIVTKNMSYYYQTSREIIDYKREAEKDERNAMIKCRSAIKESLNLLKTLAGHTIINEEKQKKFKKLVKNMSELNSELRKPPNSDKKGNIRKRENMFNQVNTSYWDTLHALRTAALEAIKQEHIAATPK